MNPMLPIMAALVLGGSFDLVEPPTADELAAGFVSIGSVRYHPGRGEIEVDGHFNLRGGFLEFLACLPEAKPHESLLALDCDPADLKAALLLLGLKEGRRPRSEADLAPIEGDRVIIRLRYQFQSADGQTVLRDLRAEDGIINGPMEYEMARCGFVFTGSTFIEDLTVETAEGETPPEIFAPRALGQLIALCHRPYAILDNPLALPYRDGDYYAYSDVFPATTGESPPSVPMVIRKPRSGEIHSQVTRMELPPIKQVIIDDEVEDSADDSLEDDSESKGER